MRLAVIASHPIQYHAPIFRELAGRMELTVFFSRHATPTDQARAGFGVGFDWDVDLLSGYEHTFLRNVARKPSLDTFGGCDTPDIGRYLANGGFDGVLLMAWHRKSFLQALVAAKRLGIPVLARGDSQLQTPRSVAKKAAKACVYPFFLRLFDAALYVGERSRVYWTHYGYPSHRLFSSPHCVDTEWFGSRATSEARAQLRARLAIAADTKVALFAGKLVPFKRPFDLIAAAAQLRANGRNIEVLIAGAGQLQLELEGAAKEAAVRCHVLGFCNQTKMPSVYAAADILVVPSSGAETWGLVANEALACGRPLVLSDAVGAAPDLVADGSVGRVFPIGDIPALARALDDILRSPPTRMAIAAKSARYSVPAAAEGIVGATRWVTQQSAGSGASSAV